MIAAYVVEQPTLANQSRRLNGRRLPVFILMTDEERLSDPMASLAAMPRGSAIVVRHREDSARITLAHCLAPRASARGIRLMVANDWRLAATMGRGSVGQLGVGLHLSESTLRHGIGHWRRLRRRPSVIVTASAHDATAVAAARRAGVDAILLAPVLPTASHPGARHLGLIRFRRMAATAGMPVFALGGITLFSLRRIAGAGAVGVAAIGLFHTARLGDLRRYCPIFPKRRKSCIKSASVRGQPNG